MLNALSIRALEKAVLFFLPKDLVYDTQSNTKGVFFCDYLQHSVHITSQRGTIFILTIQANKTIQRIKHKLILSSWH